MPKLGTKLTVVEVEKARPRNEEFNLYDTLGLYLTVAPTGAKWWRLKYRYESPRL